MKKWICLIMLSIMSVHAASTNTWLRAVDNNWANANNWDVAPTNWTDYSAGLVFGAGDGVHYYLYNNVSGAAVDSILFTPDALVQYSVNNNAVSFGAGKASGGDVLVNNSNFGLLFNAPVLFAYDIAGDRYVRANNDIRFRNVQIWTSASPNLYFQTGNGHNITFSSGYTLTSAGGVSRTPMFQGDGAGGNFYINSTVVGELGMIVQRAGRVVLNMNAGQVGNITLKSGIVSYSKDNLSFGNVIFGQTDGSANQLVFNGNDNDFGTLSITADAEAGNILNFDGTNAVSFADCSSETWASALIITNFNPGVDSLRFGTNSVGLTPAQLDSILVNGAAGTASLDSDGYLTVMTAATILSVNAVSSDLLQLVINASGDLSGYQLMGRTNLVSGDWQSVEHSDNGENGFVSTNLGYSTADGTNAVVYVQADQPVQFLRVE